MPDLDLNTCVRDAIAETVNDMTPEMGEVMVESWWERWQRHQPRDRNDEADTSGLWCSFCGDGIYDPRSEWPCPDALSVFRELGIDATRIGLQNGATDA